MARSCAHFETAMPSSPTPAPIPLVLAGRTLATAYPKRPPSSRSPHWSWRMVFTHSTTRRRTFKALGRLAEADVPKALLGAFREHSPSRVRTDKAAVKTVTDLARVWYAAQERREGPAALSPATLDGYRRDCIYIRDLIGDVKLKQFRQGDCERLRDLMLHPDYRARREASQMRARPFGPHRNGRGYSTKTTNHALLILGIILNYGKKNGFAMPDPMPAPRKAQIRRKKGDGLSVYKDYTPSLVEVERFYAALRKKPGAVRLFTLLAWKTGGRAGELGALRWGDIQVSSDGGYIRLDGKTGVRRVAVTGEVVEEVLSYRRDTDGDNTTLFSSSYGRRASRYLKQAQDAQGIPPERQWTAHGLRRRWSMDVIEAGVPVHVYTDQAGHSPAIALRDYARISDKDRRAAASRVADHKDIYGFLAEHSMSVDEAIHVLQAHLAARRQAGEHVQLVGG